MRVLLCLWLLTMPAVLWAQSRTVLPQELELTVSVEEADYLPYAREMILLTIRGVYRRHITRETLKNPDFEGFSWTQLGPDTWRDERIDGLAVKTMTRRMAVYPDRAGELTIGPFTHALTLTDEADDWFEHEIHSAPVRLSVAPAPDDTDWWFPVRDIKISDQWSNAPDQLTPGEGVLRVIRIEALGVTPEMIPPMPQLSSPSGMIFAHPDKRLVELSPQGPITYAFWRWTVRPGNDVSAIVEPLEFDYFHTGARQSHTVTISAQRIAYGETIPGGTPAAQTPVTAVQAALPSWPHAVLGVVVFGIGLWVVARGWRVAGVSALHRFALFDPLRRRMWQAARTGSPEALRRVAAALLRRDGPNDARAALLAQLDAEIFNSAPVTIAPKPFARAFLGAGASSGADASD